MSAKRVFFKCCRWGYFCFAHLPLRIIGNLLLFVILVAALVQGAFFYAQSHPQQFQQLVEEYLYIKLDFSEIDADFNLLYPSLELHDLVIHSPLTGAKWLSFKRANIAADIPKSLVMLRPSLNYFHLEGLKTNIRRDAKGNIYLANNLISEAADNKPLSKLPSSKQNKPESISAPHWLLAQKMVSLNNCEIILDDEILGLKNYAIENINAFLTNTWWKHQLKLALGPQTQNQDFQSISLLLNFSGGLKEFSKLNGDAFLEIAGVDYQAAYGQQAHRSLLVNLLDTKLKPHLQETLERDVLNIERAGFDLKAWARVEKGDLSRISLDLLNLQFAIQEQALANETQPLSWQIEQLSSQMVWAKGKENKTKGQLARDLLPNDLFNLKGQQQKQKPNLWVLELANTELIFNQHNIKLPRFEISQSEFQKQTTLALHLASFELASYKPLLSNLMLKQASLVNGLDPQAQIEALTIDLNFAKQQLQKFKVYADIKDYQQNQWESYPRLSGLNTQVWFERDFITEQAANGSTVESQAKAPNNKALDKGVISIDSADLDVFVHDMFRDPWQFAKAQGNIYWQYLDDDLWINAQDLKFFNQDLKIYGQSQLWLEPGLSPFLSIDMNFSEVNIAQKSKYLPHTLLEPELLYWLDTALISGRSDDGGVLYRGRLNEFPYDDYKGVMDISFNARDLVIEYQKGWPSITEGRARTTFSEKGMLIEVEHAKVLDAKTTKTRVALPDYPDNHLLVDGLIKAKAKTGLQFLRETNLLSESQVRNLRSSGPISINLGLKIPTYKDDNTVLSQVDIDFDNAIFRPAWLWPTRVDEVKGQLRVKNGYISAQDLNARINDKKAQIEVATIDNPGRVNEALTQVDIKTKVSAKDLLKSGFVPHWLNPGFALLSGETAIDLHLDIPNGKDNYPSIKLQSDLIGLVSQLPQPFNKSAAEPLKLNFNFNKQGQYQLIDLKLENKLKLSSTTRLIKQDKSELQRLNLIFKSTSEQELLAPSSKAIALQGEVDLSELKAWSEVFDHQMASSQSIDLNQSIPKLKINSKLPIRLALKSLKLPPIDEDEKAATYDEDAPKRFDVVNLPPINGYVQNLSIKNHRLGKFNIASSAGSEGLQIKQLSLQGENIDLKVKGEWERLLKQPITRLEGELDIKESGQFLESIGYKAIVRQAPMAFDGYIKWHGNPLDFDYRQLFGRVKFEAGSGFFEKLNPGLGRVLGLFNLNKITQRISLDFSDVASKGFKFENIKADLLFNEASLYTRDLSINSSMAQIMVDGRLNLAKELFDEMVTVIPKISSGLTLAGAAIAGPAGAAAGWLGHALVGNQVNRLSQYQYKMSGSWEEPVVERISIREKEELEQN